MINYIPEQEGDQVRREEEPAAAFEAPKRRRVRVDAPPLGTNHRPWRKIVFSALAVTGLSFAIFAWLLLSPPQNFPAGVVLRIDDGESVHALGKRMESTGLIRSSFTFLAFLRLSGDDRKLVSGEYLFAEPLSLPKLGNRLARGESGITAVRVTIPEGSSNREIARILADRIPGFDTDFFHALAKEHEGYLFPDTYFFSALTTPEDIVERMRANSRERLLTIESELKESGHDLNDVIIMASLIEKEANDDESRALVSGILWKRLDLGLPLQVDATFLYLLGKRSDELTLKDLDLDSPYNTYRYAGLPVGPIGNPGLATIKAALSPQKSPFLFYLSDREGAFHYANDFDEHRRNKQLHL